VNNALIVILIIGGIAAVYWVLRGEKFAKELR
jgi:F0F1-type ATP synthase assembly protein I